MNGFSENVKTIDDMLAPDKSFDLVKRELIIAGRRAYIYFIDGFIKDEVFEKVIEFLYKIKADELIGIDNMSDFYAKFMHYVEVEISKD